MGASWWRVCLGACFWRSVWRSLSKRARYDTMGTTGELVLVWMNQVIGPSRDCCLEVRGDPELPALNHLEMAGVRACLCLETESLLPFELVGTRSLPLAQFGQDIQSGEIGPSCDESESVCFSIRYLCCELKLQVGKLGDASWLQNYHTLPALSYVASRQPVTNQTSSALLQLVLP